MLLSQFLRDIEKYKNYQNSQENSLSQSLSQDLTINSDEKDCKDISSSETTDYEASQMVLTQCPTKLTQKQTEKVSKSKEKSYNGSSLLSEIDIDEEIDNLVSVQETKKACCDQDIKITTTTKTNREVGIQCNLNKSDVKTISIQTDMSFSREKNNNDDFGKRKVTLRLGLPRKYKKTSGKK